MTPLPFFWLLLCEFALSFLTYGIDVLSEARARMRAAPEVDEDLLHPVSNPIHESMDGDVLPSGALSRRKQRQLRTIAGTHNRFVQSKP